MSSVVGRGTAWLAGVTLILKGVGVLSVLLILNHLTVYEYGFAELVITAVPLLSLFLLPGLSTTVVADMGIARAAGDLSRVKGLFLSFIRLQLVCAIFVWAIMFFGAHAIAVWYGNENAGLLFKIISFSFLVSPFRVAAQTLQSVYFRFRQQSVQTFLEEGWKLALLVLFFFVLHMRVDGLITALVLAPVLALLSILLPLWRIDPLLWKTKEEKISFFYFLKYHGKWGIFSTYLGTVSKNIRPWIIKIFLGTEAVGIYAVVQGLIGHTSSLVPLDSVVKPMFPQFVHDRPRLYRVIATAIKYELLGYFLMSAAAAIFSPFLIGLFFPQYLPAVPLFQVMLLMLVSTAFDAIFSGVFYALQAQRNLFWASTYKLLLTVVVMPPFLYFFGLFGIAYAVIIINYLYVWERYLALKRLMPGFRLRVRDFFAVDEYDQFVIKKFSQVLIRIFRI